MGKFIRNNKVIIALILVVALAGSAVFIYRSRSNKLIDKEEYSSFRTSLEDFASSDTGGFADQQELVDFIKAWADERSLEYKEDKHGNIIFSRSAIKRKKNVTPTLIAVSMNYARGSCYGL